MSKCRKERAVALSVARTAFDSGFSAAPSLPAGAAALWHLRPREEPRVLPASLRVRALARKAPIGTYSKG